MKKATMFHCGDDGVPRLCVAEPGRCPKGIHSDSSEGCAQSFERLNAERAIVSHTSDDSFKGSFTAKSFYGKTKPREIQYDALNGVVNALEEDDATQLVAACGTGKSYMARQIIRSQMDRPGATGVGVILTSSVKLAQDTASGIRREGETTEGVFGELGEDYVVVEVHSQSRGLDGVLTNGSVDVSKIERKLRDASSEGKRVVIVSTYDSCLKVAEAQELVGDSVKADVIFHDEAHNILGQQRSTVKTENSQGSYTGFVNELPGAIQSRKRVYATATPVVRESTGSDDGAVTVEDAFQQVSTFQDDSRNRLTVYSDSPIVGSVSGFISQRDAVRAGCLVEPVYSVRSVELPEGVDSFQRPGVTADGRVVETVETDFSQYLDPKTYGAVVSTLDTLVDDPADGVNRPANVLAYTGSIESAESYRNHFRSVALARSGGLSVEEAESNVDSTDLELRRRARLRLLAENATVMAAHSRTDSESTREREQAFTMFAGRSRTEEGWSPDVRVLANVDIFSEGVSIPEIDTVVVADEEKTSERTLTQAIGRALRVVPDDPLKRYGHVVVPSVTSGDRRLTGSLVDRTVYGVTRVERGLTPSRLQGQRVLPDESTVVSFIDGKGSKEVRSAADHVRTHEPEVIDMAVALSVENVRSQLHATDPNFKSMTETEQHQFVSSVLRERAKTVRARQVAERTAELTAEQVKTTRRTARIVASALGSGDFGMVSDGLLDSFMKAGVLSRQSKDRVEQSEKVDFVKDLAAETGLAVAMDPPRSATPEHRAWHEEFASRIPIEGKERVRFFNDLRNGRSPEKMDQVVEAVERLTKDEKFMEGAVTILRSKGSPILNTGGLSAKVDAWNERLKDLESTRERREAVEGEGTFQLDDRFVRKTGELNSRAVDMLLQVEAEVD